MTFSRQRWAAQKAGIALKLAQGECGAGYGESILILSAAISAMAAEAWPGDRIDRRRFVEFTVRFSSSIHPDTISVPLLIGSLRDSNATSAHDVIQKTFANFQRSRILVGKDVDKKENEILAAYPTLSTNLLRKFSYANLLYQRVRSTFSHEYRTGEKTVSVYMASDVGADVSYYNWIRDPDRHIHFHVLWAAELVKELGVRADAEAGNFPLATPCPWWIDG